ncbi:MAG: class I SAM-dependent methyltransferase [Clostridia bacterium]|nr:class I SAM-dependent methyltransferase [Clostridia bacterium]
MTDLLTLQKSFILAHLKDGDVCADFTMGNGHDTCFLSKTVGEGGHVYAFDIQKGALESTARLLKSEGCFENYTLILDSHHNAKSYISTKIKAGMFNLGYLPGSGNKALTTKRETTLPAVKGAIELLDSDGILLIAVYPGHEEGRLEGLMLEEYFSTLSRFEMSVSKFQIVNSPTSPYFFIVEKK